MKGRFCGLLIAMLLSPILRPQPPLPGSSAKSQPKIYFHGRGPDRDVRRFEKFLEIALDDFGFVRTDSTRDADATVNVEVTREEKAEHLYAPVVWIIVNSNEQGEFIAKSCNTASTSNSVFNEPIKFLQRIQFPQSGTKRGSHLTIYVNDSQLTEFKDLLPVLKKSLADEGYRITEKPADADAELRGIRIQKLAVPMRSVVVHRSFEVLDRQSNRYYFGSGSGDVIFLGVEQGIKLEGLPCREAIEHFSMDTEGAWTDARRIAKNLREHFDKATH